MLERTRSRKDEPGEEAAPTPQALGVQAKLTVGAVNDPAEREADRVAAQVMQRLSSGPVTEDDGGVARKIRRKGAPGHGPEGGEVAADVASQIQSARGGGSAMGDGVRRSMETAFGADFSGVRIHTGDQADTLSRSLNARAFTAGSDIFFAKGEYDPGSRGGQEVLAHELTHTVQQGSADTQRISRLTVTNTKWESATTAKVSSSGAVGVAIVSDGGEPVVVKPAEPTAAELLISANLINQSIGDDEEGGWSIGTPSVRIADDKETARIKDAITKALGPAAQQDREAGWLSKLGQPSTVVFSHAKGEDFTKIVESEKATKKKNFLTSKRETRKDSTVADMVAKPGQLTQLGKAAALDIFMGNSDRLLGLFNMDNWMVDPETKTITLIDNVLAGPAGTLTTVTTYGAFGGGKANVTTAKAGFEAWAMDGWLASFCKGDLDYIAGEIVVNIVESFKVSSKKNQLRPEDQAVMAAQIAAQEGNMRTWLLNGLTAGKAALANTLKDPMKLLAGVPEEKKLEALTALYARSFFIQGADPASAWDMATSIAEARLGVLPTG